jgi:hypothetical protein
MVFVSSGNFGAFNASSGSLYRAIGNQEARAMGFGVRYPPGVAGELSRAGGVSGAAPDAAA